MKNQKISVWDATLFEPRNNQTDESVENKYTRRTKEACEKRYNLESMKMKDITRLRRASFQDLFLASMRICKWKTNGRPFLDYIFNWWISDGGSKDLSHISTLLMRNFSQSFGNICLFHGRDGWLTQISITGVSKNMLYIEKRGFNPSQRRGPGSCKKTS